MMSERKKSTFRKTKICSKSKHGKSGVTVQKDKYSERKRSQKFYLKMRTILLQYKNCRDVSISVCAI